MVERRMKSRKMTTREDWILDTIADVRRALDSALASAEDLYKKLVPEPQRSRAEHLYKTYVPELIPRPRGPVRAPDVDIIDVGTEIHLVADLPGVKKEDIDINLTPDTIEISAESKAEIAREQQPYARRERGYMAYKRTMHLPAPVIPDKAKARFNNGVLEVTMPRKEPVEKVTGVKVDIKNTGERI
ncbi:MAG: Hsp20/alpha crystallin family protein [Halobacteriota archaeon]